MEKEKSDLQYQLDSEQKGIHARRDSDVKISLEKETKSFKWTSFIALFLFGFLTFFFFRPSRLFSMQAQIKILNLMDKKEKTALALKKKKSTLMEMEAQAQKVLGISSFILFSQFVSFSCFQASC